MKYLCLYFQVHQPYRLKDINLFQPGQYNDLFDNELNEEIFRKVSKNCYLPTNEALLNLLDQITGLRIAFSLSGSFIQQLSTFSPKVFKSFKTILNHPSVEVLAETHTHGLAFLNGKAAFSNDVKLHRQHLQRLTDKVPVVFRNTELIYSDQIGAWVNELGYKGVLVEGADKILKGRSPNVVYHHPTIDALRLLTKNYRLSDDIAFRFGDRFSTHWPLTARKFIDAIVASSDEDVIFNLFMDYETFGEHQPRTSGIFEFLKQLPVLAARHKQLNFITPGEAIKKFPAKNPISMPVPVSWADQERDTSAWIGNDLQLEAFDAVMGLKDKVKKRGKNELKRDWLLLQTSDHFYYMATKSNEDDSIHAYFSPYKSPHQAFINYMNALKLFEAKLAHL